VCETEKCVCETEAHVPATRMCVAWVCACVCAYVHACVHACVHAREWEPNWVSQRRTSCASACVCMRVHVCAYVHIFGDLDLA
jgi:hypothetical protein